MDFDGALKICKEIEDLGQKSTHITFYLKMPFVMKIKDFGQKPNGDVKWLLSCQP